MMTSFTEDSLWLSFKLDNGLFCIQSDYIDSVQIPGKIDLLPGGEETGSGIMMHGGSLINVMDLRTLFCKMNLSEYTEQFGIMKDMHIAWIEDLERFVHESGEFNKPVDPHERIHFCGAEIKALAAQGGDYKAQAMELLAEAKRICLLQVVPMLDELISIYRDVNRGIVLIINDGLNQTGLLVDEVTALVSCQDTRRQEFSSLIRPSANLTGMVIDKTNIMMEINIEAILSTVWACDASQAAPPLPKPEKIRHNGKSAAEYIALVSKLAADLNISSGHTTRCACGCGSNLTEVIG